MTRKCNAQQGRHLGCRPSIWWKFLVVSALGMFSAAQLGLQSGPPGAPASPSGDLNLDGRLTWDDLTLFVVAVQDPDLWSSQTGQPVSNLAALADFSTDGLVNSDDIPGIVEKILIATGLSGGPSDPPAPPEGEVPPDGEPPQMAGAGGEGAESQEAAVDLDIDSDNTNGAAEPNRSPAEDAVEDDTDKHGKLLHIARSFRPPAVIEIDPAELTPPTGSEACDVGRFRVTFTEPLRIWRHFWDGSDTQDPIDSGYSDVTPLVVDGDMDRNGVLNVLDINPFMLALTDPTSFLNQYWGDVNAYCLDGATPVPFTTVGDVNQDGAFNILDINPFGALIQRGDSLAVKPILLYVEADVPSLDPGDVRIVADADPAGGTNYTVTDAVRATGVRAETGPPRPWQAGVGVSPFSVVNLQSGNMLTALPIIAWNPVGPAVDFTFHHNARDPDADSDMAVAAGFELGGQWRCSYSDRLVGTSTNPTWGDATITVTDADGSRDVYRYIAGPPAKYVAPAGVFSILTWNSGASEWTVTGSDQSKPVFDSAGRLVRLVDSAENTVHIDRDAAHSYRIASIRSAADKDSAGGTTYADWNRLSLDYDAQGRLETVTFGKSGQTPFTYTWTLRYTNDRLTTIEWPDDEWISYNYTTLIDYETGTDRVAGVTNRIGSTWNFSYDAAGRLEEALDPPPHANEDRYVQSFAYSDAAVAGLWETTHLDRRGYEWAYRHDINGDWRQLTNPLNESSSLTYDASHNRLTVTDPLNYTWTSTYGPVGNLLTVTSPLPGSPAQTTTYTWEQPDPTNKPNFYRLTQVADPLGHWTAYDYKDPGDAGYVDATLVTQITQQQALAGDAYGDLLTTLDYYDGSALEIHASGQLKWVETLWSGGTVRGEQHEFSYDEWGYPTETREGLLAPLRSAYPCAISVAYNPLGQPTGGGDGSMRVDQHGNPREINCWIVWSPGDSDAGGNRLGSVPSGFPSFSGLGGLFRMDPEYDAEGRPLSLYHEVKSKYNEFNNIRDHKFAYDALGRPDWTRVETNEYLKNAGGAARISRQMDYEYDADSNVTELTDSTGEVSVRTYDELGRLSTASTADMSAAYFYDAAGRLERIENSNGTKTYFYEYDAANRLLKLRHESAAAQVLSRIEYTWSLDNTVATRTEYDATVSPATTDVTTFTYDQRHRLISENRVRNGSTAVYAIEYDYDALGNRKEKRLTLSDGLHVTDYTYDVDSDDPENELTYPTRNNRLLSYREYGPDEELQRTVYYTYYDRGACSNITIKDESSPSVRKDLGLFYNGNGTLWIALWSQWQVNEQGVPQSFEMTAAKELRFDRPRQRYLMRDLDPNNGWAIVGSGLWTDYIGDAPHLDYTVSSGAAVTHSTAYLTGAGTAAASETFVQEEEEILDPYSVEFLHGDLIGSTMLRTNASGSVAQPPSAVAYTAFGEPVAGSAVGGALPTGFPRYAYAGGYGYESDLLVLQGANAELPPIALAHVGWRWYQAGIGRFVQRDPIGLRGGLNTYVYVDNDPAGSLDPDGERKLGGGYQPPEPPPPFGQPPITTPSTPLPPEIPWQKPRNLKHATHLCMASNGWWYYPGENEYPDPDRPRGWCHVCGGKGDHAHIGPWTPPAPAPPKPPPKPRSTPFPPHWGPVCFIADTPIWTLGGAVPVQQLRPMDEVLTSAHLTHRAFATVVSVTCGNADWLFEVELPAETLQCTGAHPFFVRGHGWTRAADLRVGDALQDCNGTPVPVVRVSIRPVRSVPVYSISVDNTSTYYVGASRVWTHNKPP
ncbi:tRNA nuclease WapA precursor [Phycisphaerae bacterium RAS1]|nr:tRNA nuclease WapA precursor [Phycisphaerae bacterium RAS1]